MAGAREPSRDARIECRVKNPASGAAPSASAPSAVDPSPRARASGAVCRRLAKQLCYLGCRAGPWRPTRVLPSFPAVRRAQLFALALGTSIVFRRCPRGSGERVVFLFWARRGTVRPGAGWQAGWRSAAPPRCRTRPCAIY